jgi:hypothetical protein
MPSNQFIDIEELPNGRSRIKPMALEPEQWDEDSFNTLLDQTDAYLKPTAPAQAPAEAPPPQEGPPAPGPSFNETLAGIEQQLRPQASIQNPTERKKFGVIDAVKAWWHGNYSGMNAPGAGLPSLIPLGGWVAGRASSSEHNAAVNRLTESEQTRQNAMENVKLQAMAQGLPVPQEAVAEAGKSDGYDIETKNLTHAQLEEAAWREQGIPLSQMGMTDPEMRTWLANRLREHDRTTVQRFAASKQGLEPTHERTTGGRIAETVEASYRWQQEFAANRATFGALTPAILADEYAKRTTPTIAFDEQGHPEITQAGMDKAKALYQGTIGYGIEFATEQVGGKVAGAAFKALGKVGSKIAPKWLKNAADTVVETTTKKIGDGTLKRLGRGYNKTRDLFEKFGFQSLPEEVMEEYEAAVLHPLLGSQDSPSVTGNDPLDRLIAARESLMQTVMMTPEMLVAFAIPIGAGTLVNTIRNGPQQLPPNLDDRDKQMLLNIAGIRLKMIEDNRAKRPLGKSPFFASEEETWLKENKGNAAELFRVYGGYLNLESLRQQGDLTPETVADLHKASPEDFDKILLLANRDASIRPQLETAGLKADEIAEVLKAKNPAELQRRLAIVQQNILVDQLTDMGVPEADAMRQAITLNQQGMDPGRLAAAGLDPVAVQSLMGMFNQIEALKNSPDLVNSRIEREQIAARMGDILTPNMSELARRRENGDYSGPDGKVKLLNDAAHVWQAMGVTTAEIQMWEDEIGEDTLQSFIDGQNSALAPERIGVQVAEAAEQRRHDEHPDYRDLLDDLGTGRLAKDTDLIDRLSQHWTEEGATPQEVAAYLGTVKQSDIQGFRDGSDPTVFAIARRQAVIQERQAADQRRRAATEYAAKQAAATKAEQDQKDQKVAQAAERRNLNKAVLEVLQSLEQTGQTETPKAEQKPTAAQPSEPIIPKQATEPNTIAKMRALVKAEGQTLGKSYKFGGAVWKSEGVTPKGGILLSRRVAGGEQLRIRPESELGTAVEPELDRSALTAPETVLKTDSDMQAGDRKYYDRLHQTYTMYYLNPTANEPADRIQSVYDRLLALRDAYPELKKQHPVLLPPPAATVETEAPEDLADVDVPEKKPTPLPPVAATPATPVVPTTPGAEEPPIDRYAEDVLDLKAAEMFPNAFKRPNGRQAQPFFHNSNAPQIEVFDEAKIGSNTDFGMRGSGFYFSTVPSPEYGPYTHRVYLDLNNPVPMKLIEGVDATKAREDAAYAAQVRKQFMDAGYDGMIIPWGMVGNGAPEVVVFKANQIHQLPPDPAAPLVKEVSKNGQTDFVGNDGGFKLTGEKAPDNAAIAAEEAAKAKAKAEFDAAQPDMFGEKPPKPPIEKSVGAASPEGSGEFLPKGKVKTEAPNITGLRQSVAEIERQALGYPPEVRDAARRFPEVVGRAWDRLIENREAVQDLVDELGTNPRPLSDTDVALLLIGKAQRFNDRNAAAAETVRLMDSGTAEQKLRAQ